MLVLGLALGLLSWTSHAYLRTSVGAWCYLPTILFGALAALFVAGAAVTAAAVGTARLTPQNTPRPVRLAGPYVQPGIGVAVLASLPVKAAAYLRTEHGFSLATDLTGLGFACVVLCVALPSIWRRGQQMYQPPALAEVAAAEAGETKGE